MILAPASGRGCSEAPVGTSPGALKLTGKEGKVASLMIMYANKGDTLGLRPGVGRPVAEKDLRTAVKDFQKRDAALDKTIRGQADAIEDALAGLFGKCDRTRFAQGLKPAEHVKAWRWNGHALLLSEQHDAGLSLRIVPHDVIDEQRRVVRVQGADQSLLRASMDKRRRFATTVPTTWCALTTECYNPARPPVSNGSINDLK